MRWNSELTYAKCITNEGRVKLTTLEAVTLVIFRKASEQMLQKCMQFS